MSARLKKVVKGLLGEGETDIASKSDAKILSTQKRYQVLYCIVYFVKFMLTIASGQVTI